jgi:hypothetical protein
MIDFLDDRGTQRADAMAAIEAEARADRDALQDDGAGAAAARAQPPGQRARPDGVWLLARLQLLHHPLPARAWNAAARVGEIVARRAQPGAAGRQGESPCLGRSWIATARTSPTARTWPTLLHVVHDAAEEEGVERIRFLTSHPNWMTDNGCWIPWRQLPRVMPHIEVPNQAGDDEVLENV